MYQLLVLLSLLASNMYGVVAITLDASLLTQYRYNNQSKSIHLNELNIDSIDPNVFKGFTEVKELYIQRNQFLKLDLEVFKDLVNLNLLDLSVNPLTQFTNSKKISFPFLQRLGLYLCPLTSLDSNVINGMLNATIVNINYDNEFAAVAFPYLNAYKNQLSSLKTNQLSPWKNLQYLYITTKNQTNLTKEYFNGLNSLVFLSFQSSNIKAIEVHTFAAFSNLTSLDLSKNELRSFEYLQIPTKLNELNLGRNIMNYFMLSRTMGVIKKLYLNSNQFRSFKSMDFTFLANLTYLDLSFNPHAYPNEIAGHMKPLVNLNNIVLNNLSISSIDSNFFKSNTKLKEISLGYNNISVLPFNTFSNLKDLEILYLPNNQITFLDNRTFIGLYNLSRIYLAYNKLTKIYPRTFYNLTKLASIDFNSNSISEIDSSAFAGCYSLNVISLYGNQLTKLSPRTFDNLNLTLSFLILTYNQISELDNLTFIGIRSIEYLNLDENKISTIGPGTFNSLKVNKLIDLRGNLLTKIGNGTFAGQDQVPYINLASNKINTIESGAFNNLKNLQTINLLLNELTELDNSTFSGCDNLQGIYLYGNPIASTNNLQSLCPPTAANCKVYF